MRFTGIYFTTTSTKTLASITGFLSSGLTIFPAYGFNSNGTPQINPNYAYIGFESGKYPYVLRPSEMDDPNKMESLNLNINNEKIDLKNVYVYAGSGNGVYVIY